MPAVVRLLLVVLALHAAASDALAAAPDTPAAPDTLVVCPAELRDALAPWEAHRQGQGHQLMVIAPPGTRDRLQAAIREAATTGALKTVVLVGDVQVVPTCYVAAQVNVRWGSEPTIATDQIYGDVDGDGTLDVAVGRIPADNALELAAFVRKVIQYEGQGGENTNGVHNAGQPLDDNWRRKLHVVAGVGGFGLLADSLIEAAARSVFQQVVPKTHEVTRLPADPAKSCEQLGAGAFAWIYLGHGLPSMLDAVATPAGPRSILEVADVPRIQCGSRRPLAVLVACYTGAFDAQHDCLGEELTLAERGPIATIAATRVTMPYGNSVFGCELLRAAFAEESTTLGDVWLRAQRQTLAAAPAEDALRTSLDALARGVSPPPVELEAERLEHVLLYQLLGDPLLRLNVPRGEAVAGRVVTASATNGAGAAAEGGVVK